MAGSGAEEWRLQVQMEGMRRESGAWTGGTLQGKLYRAG